MTVNCWWLRSCFSLHIVLVTMSIVNSNVVEESQLIDWLLHNSADGLSPRITTTIRLNGTCGHVIKLEVIRDAEVRSRDRSNGTQVLRLIIVIVVINGNWHIYQSIIHSSIMPTQLCRGCVQLHGVIAVTLSS